MQTTVLCCALAVLVLAACGGNGNGAVISADADSGKPTGDIADTATEVCMPNCDGKQCGPDGCGGQCGQCAMLVEQCSQEGQCELFPCESSKDCPDQLVCAPGDGECVVCVIDADCPDGTTCGADHDCHSPHPCTSDKDCKELDMLCDYALGQCVECLENKHCEEGMRCEGGYCVDAVCESGATKCDGAEVLSCPDGSGWAVSQTCTAMQYCKDGACLDLACEPGSVWCDGDVNKLCADDGLSVKYEEDCAAKSQHCFNGSCIDSVCVPNQKFCADNVTAATCLADGMDYSTLSCQAQQFCQAGECTAWACEPSKATCQGDTATVCNSLGSGYASQTNCKTQQKVCSDGKCMELACSPSADFCIDDDTLGHCAADGLSSAKNDCPVQHSCKDGQCSPWQCTPDAPVCDGKFATKCDALGLGPLQGGTDCSASGKFCSNGQCTACEPKCDGKVCGDDGCGGTCLCDDGQVCTQGQCAASTGVCAGNCGGVGPDGKCYCDKSCFDYGDCCPGICEDCEEICKSCGLVTNKGCCAGQTLKYCKKGALLEIDCSQKPSCGWSQAAGIYDCATSGGEDPSGASPLSCDAL